jgi:hypothetical protein
MFVPQCFRTYHTYLVANATIGGDADAQGLKKIILDALWKITLIAPSDVAASATHDLLAHHDKVF